jgi:hypothetical protein
VNVTGIAGTHEIADAVVPELVAEAIRTYPAGDLVFDDGDGRFLYLYWAEGRLFAMATVRGGDADVATEHTPTAGPAIETTLSGGGETDLVPREATVPTDHAQAIADGWVRDEPASVCAWTREPAPAD